MKILILGIILAAANVLAEQDKDYAVYCTTESKWVHATTNVAPTNCPTSAAHAFKADSITVWSPLEKNLTYISRGDLSDWDVVKADLTLDDTFNDLTLTNVPNGSASAVIIVNANIDTETMEIKFRKKGHTGTVNVRKWMPQYTNQVLQHELVVGVDTNSTIQYQASTNGTWSVLKIVAVGYNTANP